MNISMNMENIKVFNWGSTTSLILAALFIFCLEVAVGAKSVAISNNVENHEKPSAGPIMPMPAVVKAKATTQAIQPPTLKGHTTPPVPTLKPTTVSAKHPPSTHMSNQHARTLTSKVSQSSLKVHHLQPSSNPALPPSSNPPMPPRQNPPKPPKKATPRLITLHPYSNKKTQSLNQTKKTNSSRPHTWRGRKMSKPVLTKDQPTTISADLGDNAVPKPSTPSPDSHVSKLKSIPPSKPQTSQVNMMPTPITKVAKFFNKTDKPGHHPYHPSPASLKSKLKSATAPSQSLQDSNALSLILPDNQLINLTEVGAKVASNPPTTDSHDVSELKSISLSQPQTSQVSEVSSPSPVLTNPQFGNLTVPGDKQFHHPSTPSPVSHNSKLKSVRPSGSQTLEVGKVSPPLLTGRHLVNSTQSGDKVASRPSKAKSSLRPQTSKVSKVSKPTLKDNQSVNSTEPRKKLAHHPSTPSPVFHNSKLKSTARPGPQTLQVSKTSTSVLTDNQLGNLTESRDKLAHYPSTPSPFTHNLKSTSAPRQQISHISKVPSLLVKDTQLLNSTKSANKPAHHPNNASPRSHSSKLKSAPSSATQTSQVNQVSRTLSIDNQFVNATLSGNHQGHHHNKPSTISQNSKLRPVPPSQPQTSQVSKVSSPVLTNDQIVNSTQSEDKSGHQPSPIPQNSELNSVPPPQTQALQDSNASNPVSTYNSTESVNQSNHYLSTPSPVFPNSDLKSAPPSLTQSLQLPSPASTDNQLVTLTEPREKLVHHPSTPLAPVLHNPKLKSTPPSQPQTLQVSKVSSPVLPHNQFVNSTEPRNKQAHHPPTPSPGIHNAKLKSKSPSRAQTHHVSKVSSPVSTDNQLVTLTEPSSYNLAYRSSSPSPLFHVSKLKSSSPSRPQTSQVNKVSKPFSIVKNIRFVTSTESGDKAGHFKFSLG